MSISTETEQDFELNLASIIDCFTVLITFMLASASFLSIGIMDAGIAAGAPSTTGIPPAVQVSIELKPDHAMQIVVTGHSAKVGSKQTLLAKSDTWDYEGMAHLLQGYKSQWPDLNGATLIAENTVQYQDVVRAMDQTRKVLPAVLLGGF